MILMTKPVDNVHITITMTYTIIYLQHCTFTNTLQTFTNTHGSIYKPNTGHFNDNMRNSITDITDITEFN